MKEHLPFLNTGIGSIDKFFVVERELSSADFYLDSVDQGSWYDGVSRDTMWFDGSDIVNFGNGDSLLDQYETFTFTTKNRISSCKSFNTRLTVGWGCSPSEVCQTSNIISAMSTTWPKPIMSRYFYFDTNSCFGPNVPRNHEVIFINSGSGPARDLRYAVTKRNFNPAQRFKIDHQSFQYKIGENGALNPATISLANSINQAQTGFTSCLSGIDSTDILNYNAVEVIWDSLNAGDTIFMYFETNACCPESQCLKNEGSQSWDLEVYSRVYGAFNQLERRRL